MGGSSYEASSYRSDSGYSAADSIQSDHLPDVEVSRLVEKGNSDNHPINRRTISTDSPNPVIVVFDDTGSMGDRVDEFYKRAPMFYGRIVGENLLADPAISFIVVGDANSDKEPLQVTPFARGDSIDEHIQSLYIERGGGGQAHESYELAAYYALRKTKFTCELDAKPFLFMYGDEAYYEKISKSIAKNIFGDNNEIDIKSSDVFKDLLKKYDVFLIRTPYCDSDIEPDIQKSWEKVLGRTKTIETYEPNQIVDTMIGIITLRSGYGLDDYCQMMRARKQTETRIKHVKRSLEQALPAISPVKERSAEPVRLLDGPLLQKDSTMELESGVIIHPDGKVVLPNGQELSVPSNGNIIIVNVIKDSTIVQDSVVMRSKISRRKKRKDDESDEL